MIDNMRLLLKLILLLLSSYSEQITLHTKRYMKVVLTRIIARDCRPAGVYGFNNKYIILHLFLI